MTTHSQRLASNCSFFSQRPTSLPRLDVPLQVIFVPYLLQHLFCYQAATSGFVCIAVPIGPVQNVSVNTESTRATIIIAAPKVVTGIFTYDVIYSPAEATIETVEVNGTNSPITIGNLTDNTVFTVTVSSLYKGIIFFHNFSKKKVWRKFV